MTLVRKLKATEAILDEHIRPMLAMDGGNMELLDIREEDPYIDIFIRYLGGCAGCSSSMTGTLYAIESVLRQKLDVNIRVLPI
jgi:NifU-like protein